MARYVLAHFSTMLDPLRASYSMVAGGKAAFGVQAMAAIAKAYGDAGQEMPGDLSPRNLR